MPLSALIYFYRRRLRTHPVQETLAGLGVAVGVALVFAVQVATSSITSGTDQVVKSIVGSASLQLRSRSPSGVDERITDRVRALAGVQTAAPVLAMTADVRGPSGREATVQLVPSKPGAERQVRRELEQLAGGRLIVAGTGDDVRLLQQATAPNRKATGFFAFVGGLVGMLLAFNAMLLSAPERRRMIADLRIQGARPGDLVRLLLFQALCLGVVASAIGVVLGALLSRSIFHHTPGYLAAAFPLGTQTV